MNKKRFKTIPIERSMLPTSLLNPDEGIPQGDGEFDTEGMEDDCDSFDKTTSVEDNFQEDDFNMPLYTVNTDPLIEARGVAYVDGEDPCHSFQGWKLVKRNNCGNLQNVETSIIPSNLDERVAKAW